MCSVWSFYQKKLVWWEGSLLCWTQIKYLKLFSHNILEKELPMQIQNKQFSCWTTIVWCCLLQKLWDPSAQRVLSTRWPCGRSECGVWLMEFHVRESRSHCTVLGDRRRRGLWRVTGVSQWLIEDSRIVFQSAVCAPSRSEAHQYQDYILSLMHQVFVTPLTSRMCQTLPPPNGWSPKRMLRGLHL